MKTLLKALSIYLTLSIVSFDVFSNFVVALSSCPLVYCFRRRITVRTVRHFMYSFLSVSLLDSYNQSLNSLMFNDLLFKFF